MQAAGYRLQSVGWRVQKNRGHCAGEGRRRGLTLRVDDSGVREKRKGVRIQGAELGETEGMFVEKGADVQTGVIDPCMKYLPRSNLVR